MPPFKIKHSKLTSVLYQLTTMLVSSSEEPLYTAVVEQFGTGGGTVGENYMVCSHYPLYLIIYKYKCTCTFYHLIIPFTPPHTCTCSNMHKHTYTGGGGAGKFLQIARRILAK